MNELSCSLLVFLYFREIFHLLQSWFFLFLWVITLNYCTMTVVPHPACLKAVSFAFWDLALPSLCVCYSLCLFLFLFLSGFLAHCGVFQSAMNGKLKLHGTFGGPSARNLSAWSPAMPGQCLLIRSVPLIHTDQDFMALARYTISFSLFHQS